MKKHRIVTILGFAISIVLLYFSLRGIRFAEIARTFDHADMRLIFVPFLFIAIAVTSCAFRWSRVCGGNARFGDAWVALMIGLFVNNVLPARIGEVARGYVMSKKTGLSLTYTLSTVFADRFFDLIGLLTITFVFFPKQALPPTVSKAILALVLLLIICIVTMILLSRKQFAGVIARMLHNIKKPFFSKMAHRILEVQENLRRVNSPLNLLSFTALSLVSWMAMSTALYFVALSLGVNISYAYVPFVCALLNMGLTIPSSPGYIGVYQFLLTNLLLIFAVPKAEAFTVSVLFHASWYLPYNVVGAILLVKENLRFKEIRGIEEERENRGD
jgi:glycosyltransferase 2 family protein